MAPGPPLARTHTRTGSVFTETYTFKIDSIGGHDVVHLLQLVGEPLLLGELVLLQGHGQLLVVLHRVRVQLVQGAVRVELGGVQLKGEIESREKLVEQSQVSRHSGPPDREFRSLDTRH